MRKFVSTSILVAGLALGSLQTMFAGEVKVGATPVPHAAILKSVIPMLDKKGVQLKIYRLCNAKLSPCRQIFRRKLYAAFALP